MKSDINEVRVKIIMPKSQYDKLKGKYLYIYEQGSHLPFDSVKIENETNIISFIASKAFQPQVVVLKYNDTSAGVKYRRLLGFKNPFFKNSINSYFYIDIGNTTVGSYYNNNSYVNYFHGSIQNEPFLGNIQLSYPDSDNVNRNQIIDNNIKIINKYPYSMELLKQIFEYKNYFTIMELKYMLKHFNSDIKNNYLFNSFELYFQNSISFDKIFPKDLKLLDIHNKIILLHKTPKFNLIVFWASWCGPCRIEIPQLKKIYKKFRNNGLEITSISIDNDNRSWKDALLKEQMPWNQFLNYNNSSNLFFDIKLIPKSYLFNNGKLVAKFNGYNKDFEENLNLIIK